jgi:HPt (histidine-containing phosphotransfer) domain-containing protein
VANAHAEADAAREAKLQAQVKVAQEIQRVKEAMARQAQREVADLKKKLEDTKWKAKDVAADLQVVIEGKFPTLPRADSVCFSRSRC